MNHALVVTGCNSYCRVLATRGRTADQKRHLKALTLHLFRDVHHLVERRGDESAEADHVHPVLFSFLQDDFGRLHHAEIDDLVAVAAEDHPHDVLSNVVNVAFDRRHQHLAGTAEIPGLRLLRFHERREVSDCFLHHSSALDHLRQEHLPGSEEVTDHAHPRHQRSIRSLGVAGRAFAELLRYRPRRTLRFP